MLTDEMKHKIEAEIETCPNKKCACIDAMQIVQSSLGWISDDSLKAIADFLDMTIDELDSVATFYNHIYRKPVGRHIILICNSVSCWIMGFGTVRRLFYPAAWASKWEKPLRMAVSLYSRWNALARAIMLPQ